MLQMTRMTTRMNTNCGSPMVGSMPVRVLPKDPTEVQPLVSRYELSVICQSASAAPDPRHQDRKIFSSQNGAPRRTRICDLLVRSVMRVEHLVGSSVG